MGSLQVFPSELKFVFQLGRELVTTMSLVNPTGERVAFKVKTTAPDKYCVRPCAGFVEPSASRDLMVIMQAYKEVPSDIHACGDKFLVQSAVAHPMADHVTTKMFSQRYNDVYEVRLTVSLELPENPVLLGRYLRTGGPDEDDQQQRRRQRRPEEEVEVEEEEFGDDRTRRSGGESDDDGEGIVGELSPNNEDGGDGKGRIAVGGESEWAYVAKDVLLDHLDRIMHERDELKRLLVELSPRTPELRPKAGGGVRGGGFDSSVEERPPASSARRRDRSMSGSYAVVAASELEAGAVASSVVGAGECSVTPRRQGMAKWQMLALVVGSFVLGRLSA